MLLVLNWSCAFCDVYIDDKRLLIFSMDWRDRFVLEKWEIILENGNCFPME